MERVNEYVSLAKFTFPKVTKGCVIEYSYFLTSKSIYELRDWYFQEEIPVRYSEIRVRFPDIMSFTYLFQGNEGMVAKEEKDGAIRYEGKNSSMLLTKQRFIMENAPAMKEEGFVTTMDDYKARIRFQLSEYVNNAGRITKVMTDWKGLQQELKEQPYFGQQLLKKGNNKNMLEKVLPLAAGLTSEKEKAWFFYNYLTTNLSWNGNYSVFSKSEKLNDIFSQGKANSGTLNMMLYVLLDASGIKANPVLLSTRSHGKMYEEYPILDQFNHMMVQVELDGKKLFMDATSALRPPGYPSIEALNGRGLRLDFESGEPAWIAVPAPKDGADIIVFDMKLDEAGTLAGTIIGTHKGYNAIQERQYFTNDKSGSHWKKRLTKRYPEAEILSASCGNLNELEKAFNDTIKVNIPNAAQVSGDLLYFSPLVYSEFDENVFKMKERNYPVNISYPFMEQVVLKLTLPDGYEVESLPEMVNYSLPADGGSFFFGATLKENGVVQFSARINVSKLLFSPAEYPALKEIFDLLVKKQEEMIVVKKKA